MGIKFYAEQVIYVWVDENLLFIATAIIPIVQANEYQVNAAAFWATPGLIVFMLAKALAMLKNRLFERISARKLDAARWVKVVRHSYSQRIQQVEV